MDREILFRGFHEDKNGSTTIYVGSRTVKGEWVYGYYWLNDTVTRQTAHITDNYGNIYDVVPSTIGEYTGLYGEDKKRIFEGDKCIVTVFNYDGSDSQYSCEARYGEGCFFVGNNADFYVILQNIEDTQADITVTGTIFDKEATKCD